MIGNLEEILTNIAGEGGAAGPEETAGQPDSAGTEGTAGAPDHTGTEETGEAPDHTGTEETGGAPDHTGAEETGGAPDHTGAGETVAAPDHAGEEETVGAPGHAGTEETAGASGHAGSEETAGAGTEEAAETSDGAGTEENAGLTGNPGSAGAGGQAEAGDALWSGGPLGLVFGETGAGEGVNEEMTADSYVIGGDGETQFVFDAEPETEYIVSTPAVSDSEKTSTFSKTYHAAAGTIAKTAQSAAKSAAPALKTIAFNVVNAVLIVIIGVQIARLLRKTLNKTFEKIHMDASLRTFLSSVIYVLVCGVAGFMALERVGVSSASIVAILGSAGLAVSLSLQDFLANFAGGVIILILKPFRPGDYIVCGSAEGTVLSTSLFYTTLNTIDNRQMILPNGALSNANLINVTAEPRRRLEIRVDISYDSDIRTAKEILRRLFDGHPDIIHEEEVVVFVDSLGESGITLVCRGWIAKENYWSAKWKLTEDVKYAFDEAGVVIPYRQVVVHMPDGGNEDGGNMGK